VRGRDGDDAVGGGGCSGGEGKKVQCRGRTDSLDAMNLMVVLYITVISRSFCYGGGFWKEVRAYILGERRITAGRQVSSPR
jgi:hypothetical protein